MMDVDLKQYEKVGVAIDWRGGKHALFIPADTPEERKGQLILKARVEVFLSGPNYVPTKEIDRRLGLTWEADFLRGNIQTKAKIATIKK